MWLQMPSLPNLRHLVLGEHYGLKEVDCGGLQSLELLTVHLCYSLRTLPSVATTLRTLNLAYCESLESLKASSSLPNLRDLRLHVCHKLKELDCEGCGSLEHLELGVCHKLERLQMPSLPNLRYLELCKCYGLKEVDCGGCGSLEHLFLYDCNGLERLQMPSLPNLRHLDLRECYGLKEVDCGGLPSLQNLSVAECGSLKRISVLPRSLETLRLQKCRQLQVLDGLDTLTNLRGVRIVECFHIAEESLPENIKRLPRLPYRWL
ncbi:hypothetical protein KP509_15G040800 [Ceratopteris richardii]|uniref:Uncharacterized protein n=1 Tax=Ceratopteris richardii TaxID=49495 RepID=A0A8T2T2Q7_CERRI|nr:hypothetical protein KP509_15G040800 [Ceratopteris richardii]